jgi:homoserine dehydrogenase
MDCVVKLLAICERVDAHDGADGPPGGRVRARAPGDDPAAPPLAGVREAFNAVFVEADAAGQLMFYGRGAGGDPTASAVLGDVVAVARHRVGGGRGPGESAYADLPVLDMGQALTRYHISLDVADRPGVLAQVASAFAEHDVSIETVRQQQVPDGERGRRVAVARRASLVVVTHAAPDAALSATVDALAALPIVRGSTPSCVWKVSDMAHQWRGVIREYADRLPMLAGAPTVTSWRAAPRSSPRHTSPSGSARRSTSSTKASTRPAPSRTAG